MFVVGDPDHTDEDEAAVPDLEDWFAYVRGKGAYLSGVRLQPTDDATTVKVRSGELLVTDGPAPARKGLGRRLTYAGRTAARVASTSRAIWSTSAASESNTASSRSRSQSSTTSRCP